MTEFIVGSRARDTGYEFHFSTGDHPDESLCGVAVQPTQIPVMFYGVDSAIEGRWCERCEALSAVLKRNPGPAPSIGDAPCV